MKKSEYRDQLEVLLGQNDPAIPGLLRLADKLGVQWDPEEPELPERLTMAVEEPGVRIDDQSGRIWLDFTTIDEEQPLTPPEREEIKELLACYNFVRRLDLNDPGMIPDYTAHFLRLALDEEREKLR